jgi:uracil-DNA glycosylase
VTKTDWNPVLTAELSQPYWAELQAFVAAERSAGPVFPPRDDVFAALHLTPFAEVKVVILGQDPYHGPGQAHGLCFSVRRPTPPPPSLVNMFKELRTDIGLDRPVHGDLSAWARQGVLLLNTTLTVRAHQANSHQGRGWERFTDAVIAAVAGTDERVVFVLWGAAARKKKSLIEASGGGGAKGHAIVESAHPSPLSANNGFFGSRPFSRINDALAEAGRLPIDWALTHDG